MEIQSDSQHKQHTQCPCNIGFLFTVNKIQRNLPLLQQIKCNNRYYRFALPRSSTPRFVDSWVIFCNCGRHDFHLSPAQGERESQNVTFSQLIFTICLVLHLLLEFSLNFSSKLHKQSKAEAELEVKRELLLVSALQLNRGRGAAERRVREGLAQFQRTPQRMQTS